MPIGEVLKTFFLTWAAFAFLVIGAVNYVNAYIWLSRKEYHWTLLAGFVFFAMWLCASHLIEEARGD